MTIHELDRTLTKLAAKREALAHDPIKHVQIEAASSRTDQERQDQLAKLTDKELYQYEIDRVEIWRSYPMTRKQKIPSII